MLKRVEKIGGLLPPGEGGGEGGMNVQALPIRVVAAYRSEPGVGCSPEKQES
jgi:hypothetical protein